MQKFDQIIWTCIEMTKETKFDLNCNFGVASW